MEGYITPSYTDLLLNKKHLTIVRGTIVLPEAEAEVEYHPPPLPMEVCQGTLEDNPALLWAIQLKAAEGIFTIGYAWNEYSLEVPPCPGISVEHIHTSIKPTCRKWMEEHRPDRVNIAYVFSQESFQTSSPFRRR